MGITLGDLLFATNSDTAVAIFDNETGEMLRHPATADDMMYAVDEYEDCLVMDINTEIQFGVAVINICIEV